MKPQFLVGAVLSGFLALGCETESSAPSNYTEGAPQVHVVAPDGRKFIAGPGRVEVYPARDGRPERYTFVVAAGVTGRSDPTGRLFAGFSKPVAAMASPGLINEPLDPDRVYREDDTGASAENETGPIPSGRLHVELRAGRMTGRVETPDGSYQITGSYGLLCWKPQGDVDLVDENRETPLCQRFASLYPAQ